MEHIKFTYDTSENFWYMDKSKLGLGVNELHFCFVSNLPKTRFVNLSFSYEIKHNDQILEEKEYPPPDVEYHSADNSPLVISFFDFEPDKKYYVTVKVKNESKYRQDTFEVVGIRPNPPFDSWTWNGETWVAPVPRPEEGFYEWIESKKQWNKVSDFNANLVETEPLKRPDGLSS